MTLPSFIALLAVIAMTVGLFWGLFRMLKPAPGAVMVCTTCGHCGPARTLTRGSLMIELVLWLAFLLPGLIYSIWRLSTRGLVCESCGATALVKPDSPVGRRMLASTDTPSPEQQATKRGLSSFPQTRSRR
ncbi:MAG: hypothetical protein RLZZ524_3128 [Pseudomonadota bacterium]